MADITCQKETSEEILNLFYQIENLLLVESKSDPPTDPYRSKYKARDLLEKLKLKLQTEYEKLDHVDAMMAHVWLQLGIISVDTDEPKAGEDQFNACIESLNSKELTPECIVTCVSVYNNLGLLWSQRTEWERAFDFFETAEKYYKEFKEKNINPIDPGFLFTSKTTSETDGQVLCLEKLYTLTLYYLAQCYIHKGDSISSAVCCHATLKRQLDYADFNNTEWALNMATLSQVCLEKNAFSVAREGLYSASKVHADYEEELHKMKTVDEQKYDQEYERWRNVSGDLDRCWGKYGLTLLEMSKERLMVDDDPDSMKRFEPPDEVKKLSLGNKIVESISSPIPAAYVLTYGDAVKVFTPCLRHLNQARSLFSLNEHATDHAHVVQDISHLYQALVFFVESEADQCKIHKKRINELESLVKEFNPKFYVTVCRELWYELAEIYSDMYELKHDILLRTPSPTSHQITKINWLIKKSLTNYIELIQSFKDVRSGEYPEKYAEEWEKPMLLAFFYSARLLGKIITSDKTQLKNNLVESLNNYQYIINYCNKNKNAVSKFSTELPLCHEMVKLLPVKIEKIISQSGS